MIIPMLLISGLLVVADEMPMQSGACTVAGQMKSKMLPPDSTDSQTQVVHAALLYYGDAFAGVLYGTRAGTVWYQGSGKFSQPISSASRDRAQTMLGIAKAGSSETALMAPKPSFADVLAPDVQLKGCF